MAKIANSIIDLVGNTPLVRLNKLTLCMEAEVLVKLESFNPVSCVKERIGVSMIEDAEKKGLINKDTLIIEPTSGNTGIGLAFTCAAKGYKLILTMPDTMSIERRLLVKAFGAKLVLTEGAKGMKAQSRRLRNCTGNSRIPSYPSNSRIPQTRRSTE